MERKIPDMDPHDMIMTYHEETKHHFDRYARAPGDMDWANPPNPFRRFDGASLIRLPLLPLDGNPMSPQYDALYSANSVDTHPVTIRTISRLFEYALAGIPSVVSDLPEMSPIVNKYKLGEIVPTYNIEKQIIAIKLLLAKNRKNDIKKTAIKNFTWDVQSNKFMQIILGHN